MSTRLPEGARLLTGDLDKIRGVWERLSEINGVFDDYSRTPDSFFQMYLRRDTFWLERDDGNGILYLTMIQPGLSAFAHVAFWDKRLRGRENFTLECLHFAVSAFDLRKVNVTLPEFSFAAVAFAERVGFRREGRLRDWSYCNGKLYGVYWLGMTREEIFDGVRHISEQDHSEQPPAVPVDDGPPEPVQVPGGVSDGRSIDAVQSAGAVVDVGVDSAEPASDQSVPLKDSPDGERR